MSGMKALIKETPESSLVPSSTGGPPVRATCESRKQVLIRHGICQGIDLDFPVSSTVRNKVSVVYKPPNLWYFS